MDPLALGLVALAAVLHAAWNILLKSAGDPLRTVTLAMVASTALLVPLAAAGWLAGGRPAIPPEAWALGIVSGLVEVLYFVFLTEAYRRGDISVVYPIARGIPPVLAVVIGVAVLGERLEPAAWLGVGLLVAGLLTVQRPWRFLGVGAAGRAAAGFAILTGTMTATYSALDRVGVQLVAPWIYIAILWPVGAAGLLLVDGVRRSRGGAGTATIPEPGRAVGAGMFMLGAYACVLGALSLAPLAIVGPLRESAVLLISTWGIFRLREAAGRREIGLRLAGSALVVAGATVLALGA